MRQLLCKTYCLQILSDNNDEVGIVSALPKIFCSDFSRYINATESQSLNEKMCNLTQSLKLIGLTKTFLEDLDLEKFVHLALIIDNILEQSQMSKEQAENVLNTLKESQEFFDENGDLVDKLINITSPVVENLTQGDVNGAISSLGILLCNDTEAFFIASHIGIVFPPAEKEEEEKKLSETPADFCSELNQKMNETMLGKFVWKLISPYLMGDILYTPIDDLTETIIKEANQSAPTMQDFMKKAATFASLSQSALVLLDMEENLIEAQVRSSKFTFSLLCCYQTIFPEIAFGTKDRSSLESLFDSFRKFSEANSSLK